DQGRRPGELSPRFVGVPSYFVHPDESKPSHVGEQARIPWGYWPIVALAHVAPCTAIPSHNSPRSMRPLPQVDPRLGRSALTSHGGIDAGPPSPRSLSAQTN